MEIPYLGQANDDARLQYKDALIRESKSKFMVRPGFIITVIRS